MKPMTALFLAMIPALVAHAGNQIEVTMVVDTSPTAQSAVWHQYSLIAGDLFEAMAPGDKLTIYSAEHTGPRKRLSLVRQENQSGKALLRHLWKEEISPRADTRPDVTAAISHAAGLAKQTEPNSSMVVALLNHSLTDDQAQSIWHAARGLHRNGQKLILVGNTRTNQLLLAAAGGGVMRFELLDQAEPAKWLRIKTPSSRAKPVAPASTSETDRPSLITTDEAMKVVERVSAAIQRGVNAVASRQAEAEESQDGAPSAHTSAQQHAPSSTEAAPTSPHPDTALPIGRQQAGSHTTRARDDPDQASTSEQPDTEGRRLGSSTADAPELRPPDPASGPGQDAGAQAGAEPAATADGPDDADRSPSVSWVTSMRYLVVPLLTMMALAIPLLLRVQYVRARRRQRAKLQPAVEPSPKRPPATLRARCNGHHHQLGPLEKLPTIHIGSGDGTTLKIRHDEVEPRHAQLFRRKDALWIKNLARRGEIRVNDQTLKPRRRCRLALPAEVALSEHVDLLLDLVRPRHTPVAGEA